MLIILGGVCIAGNPWTDTKIDNEGAVDFWVDHAIISADTKDVIKRACNFSKPLKDQLVGGPKVGHHAHQTSAGKDGKGLAPILSALSALQVQYKKPAHCSINSSCACRVQGSVLLHRRACTSTKACMTSCSALTPAGVKTAAH